MLLAGVFIKIIMLERVREGAKKQGNEQKEAKLRMIPVHRLTTEDLKILKKNVMQDKSWKI